MSKEFKRQETHRHSRLGKKRKKLQTWRRPKGRDSKMRLKMKSYPISPTIGHRSSKKDSGKIKGLTPIIVHNLKDLGKCDKNSIIIIAKIGAKKKLDIIKKAQEKNIKILNVRETK